MTGAFAPQPSAPPHALPAVAEVMRPALSTAGSDDNLASAAAGGRFRHLPVVGGGGRTETVGITGACRALLNAPTR